MNDLLSKDHYCYKIYTLLMKSSAYPISIDNPAVWATPYFYKKILIPTSMVFQKSQPPKTKGMGRDSHYDYYI